MGNFSISGISISRVRHLPSNAERARKLLRCLGFLSAVAIASSSAPALSMTQAEEAIMKQQEALVWTTDYEGLVDGQVGPETIKAIRKFQSRIGNPATGSLTAVELDRLLKEGRAKKTSAGFKEITDKDAGVFVGVPLAFVSSPTRTKWGRHYGKQAGLAIDTLRFGSEVSLRDLYDKLLSINNRTITYQRFVDNRWFVISAFEGNAAVYVRADVVTLVDRQTEIRGFSIWMSKNRPPEYQALAPAMTSSFKSTESYGGNLLPVANTNRELQLKPNPPPIPTNGGSPANLDDCFRGLGPASCPEVLSARP